MGKHRVLIVDDEMDMRIFMSTLFKTSGHDVFATRDGREGIRKAREIKPHLVVLDVMMPGEGGVKMYRALKSDPRLRDIPVIMLSAVKKESFQHYLNMLNTQIAEPIPQPDTYIEKPPDAGTLLEIAKKLMNRPTVKVN